MRLNVTTMTATTRSQAITGYAPFPWQAELYRLLLAGEWDRLKACDIPTGLGKTAIIPIWLIALGVLGLVRRQRLGPLEIGFHSYRWKGGGTCHVAWQVSHCSTYCQRFSF